MSTIPDMAGGRQAPSPSSGERLAPRGYFADGAWPDDEPMQGAPDAVLYAAQLASFLRKQATADHLTLPKGLAAIAKKTGVPAGTLRHVADGDRWPGIEIVARVELAYMTDIVGFSALLVRRARQAATG